MNLRVIKVFLIFALTACATNQTTKHGQKKGKWVYHRGDGQIDRVEFYKPIKDHIPKEAAFQLGWPYGKYKDSLIYGEELIRIKQYYYNDDGELDRIEKIDTSVIFRDLNQIVPPPENPKS